MREIQNPSQQRIFINSRTTNGATDDSFEVALDRTVMTRSIALQYFSVENACSQWYRSQHKVNGVITPVDYAELRVVSPALVDPVVDEVDITIPRAIVRDAVLDITTLVDWLNINLEGGNSFVDERKPTSPFVTLEFQYTSDAGVTTPREFQLIGGFWEKLGFEPSAAATRQTAKKSADFLCPSGLLIELQGGANVQQLSPTLSSWSFWIPNTAPIGAPIQW